MVWVNDPSNVGIVKAFNIILAVHDSGKHPRNFLREQARLSSKMVNGETNTLIIWLVISSPSFLTPLDIPCGILNI